MFLFLFNVQPSPCQKHAAEEPRAQAKCMSNLLWSLLMWYMKILQCNFIIVGWHKDDLLNFTLLVLHQNLSFSFEYTNVFVYASLVSNISKQIIFLLIANTFRMLTRLSQINCQYNCFCLLAYCYWYINHVVEIWVHVCVYVCVMLVN